jgi:hypothetical protein
VHKENAICVKYVGVPTDCVGSRNTSCRGTGLKVTKIRKSNNDNNNEFTMVVYVCREEKLKSYHSIHIMICNQNVK